MKNGEYLEITALDQENIPDLSDIRVPLNIETVVGKVFKSGQSQFLKGIDNIEELSPNRHRFTTYRAKTVMSVPIRWQDKSVGVLQAIHSNPNAFDESDLKLLESTAVWTAIAIGNAHQYKQLQRRLHESEAILAISNAMTEVFDLDELLHLIAERILDIVNHADWATIHLLHPKTRQLEMVASAGLEISAIDYLINSGEGIAGLVIAEGEVINVPDLQRDRRRLPIDLATRARALLSAPVETQRERIGTITVQCATPGTFTKDDERLLTIFGVQAGMAIENARLHRIQKEAREKAEVQKKRMQTMAKRVVKAQEEERGRIARELHDESGQSLTSLKISLELIRASLPDGMDDLKARLKDVVDLTDTTMTNLRMLSHNLRPPGLDAYGLDAALGGLCHDVAKHTALTINYNGTEVPGLEAISALSLYRFAQEALTNAAKHSKATDIQMTLSHDSEMITLAITDNGIGFSPPDFTEAVPLKGAGLIGMIERLEMVNGILLIESKLEHGSCLKAVIPYSREDN
jgi:signal transduction histidine kinase